MWRVGGVDNFISQSSAGSTKRPSARCWLQEKKKNKLETRPIAQQAVCNKDQRNVLVTTTSLRLVGVRVPPSGPTSYLPDELHNEVHHQLGVLVEHALPQLVHQSLGEVEDVVDQDLVAAAAAEGQRGVFTWK